MGIFWGECPMFRHTAVFNFRTSLGTRWVHKWNCWTEAVLKVSFPWILRATWQWKIRVFWRWCSHEFRMKMDIPWPSVTRKLSTQAGTPFGVNINIISNSTAPQRSAIAPSLWYTLLLFEAWWCFFEILWNHQWIPQVRFKSRFWMVKSFPDESE